MSAKKSSKEKTLFGSISINLAVMIIGICLAIWADKVTNLISIIIGLLLVLIAAYYVIDFIRDKNREDGDREVSKIIAAIFLSIIGCLLIANASFIKEFISIVVGLCLAISGLSKLHDALDLRKSNPEEFKKPLLFAILSVVFGALCILGKLVVPDLMLRILGVMMILFSISSTCSTTFTAKIIKQNKEESIRDNAIEAEIIDTEAKSSKKSKKTKK